MVLNTFPTLERDDFLSLLWAFQGAGASRVEAYPIPKWPGDTGRRSGLRGLLGWGFLCRPLCENPPDAERQETQEEEDDREEEDPEPLLQRVLQLRDPL